MQKYKEGRLTLYSGGFLSTHFQFFVLKDIKESQKANYEHQKNYHWPQNAYYWVKLVKHLIFHGTYSEWQLCTNVEDRLAPSPLLIFFFTVTDKCGFYLSIEAISQMDNLCCLLFALKEEWGVKAAVKAGTPLVNAVWVAWRPWGAISSPSHPVTDGPHSSTVYLMLPSSASAVKWNIIFKLCNASSNYLVGASIQQLIGVIWSWQNYILIWDAFISLCYYMFMKQDLLWIFYHFHPYCLMLLSISHKILCHYF